MEIDVKARPVLDPDFVPAVLWNRAYRTQCEDSDHSEPLGIALSRSDGTNYTLSTTVLPLELAHLLSPNTIQIDLLCGGIMMSSPVMPR
jgi:hypothetical protein